MAPLRETIEQMAAFLGRSFNTPGQPRERRAA
jgi:hypothetical protein